MECKVTHLGDMRALCIPVCWLNDLNLLVPALISFGKQQDIMKGVVEGMEMTDMS